MWYGILEGLADFSISFPTGIETETFMKIPIPTGFKWTEFHPFGFLKGQQPKQTATISASATEPLADLQEAPQEQAAELERQSADIGREVREREEAAEERQDQYGSKLDDIKGSLLTLTNQYDMDKIAAGAAQGAMAGGFAGGAAAGGGRGGDMAGENR